VDKDRLLVALDLPDGNQAMALARELRPLGVGFKVGMQLFYREGMAFVQALQDEVPDNRILSCMISLIPRAGRPNP
jgi:orotidine-5'-phosphate decarboxylase